MERWEHIGYNYLDGVRLEYHQNILFTSYMYMNLSTIIHWMMGVYMECDSMSTNCFVCVLF